LIAQRRIGETGDFVFIENFTLQAQAIDLGSASARDLLSGNSVTGLIELPPAGSTVLAMA